MPVVRLLALYLRDRSHDKAMRACERLIDLASTDTQIDRFTIHDDHAKGRWLTVPEIFIYSSNIGSAKMAVEAGADRQREFLGKLGLLTAPQVEIAEIGRPEWPSAWHLVNTMTIAFGHGISVSPLQMVTAVGAVVNGGVLHRATFLKHPDDYRPQGTRVLSRQTSGGIYAALPHCGRRPGSAWLTTPCRIRMRLKPGAASLACPCTRRSVSGATSRCSHCRLCR